MTDRPPTIVEYGAFQQPPSLLFRDYLLGSDRVAPFNDGGRWDLDALAAASAATLEIPRRRQDLAFDEPGLDRERLIRPGEGVQRLEDLDEDVLRQVLGFVMTADELVREVEHLAAMATDDDLWLWSTLRGVPVAVPREKGQTVGFAGFSVPPGEAR